MSESKQEIDFAGAKVSSSKIPDFKYIPYQSLVRTAARFELGIERKQEKAWNALSNNQEVLTDLPFVIERASHAAHHAMRLIAILTGAIPDDGEDHAAAVAWSGHFLCEATRALAEAKPILNCSSCGGDGKIHDNVGLSIGKCPACWGTGKVKVA